MKDINDFHPKLVVLPPYHQLAFGIVVAERFLPNYFAFHFAERAGNPYMLLNGIDFLKHVVYTHNYEQDTLDLLDELIEDATPDLDEYPGNFAASMALDVSSIFYECFTFVKTHDTKHIHNCSKIAFESIETYIQKTDNLSYSLSAQELEEYFASHKLLQEEVQFQSGVLDELSVQETVNQRFYLRQANYPLTLHWQISHNEAG